MWELDEYGRPKQNWGMASGMWPENDPLVMNSMAGNPQQDPAPEQYEPIGLAPPAPEPQQPESQQSWLAKPRSEGGYGIGTTGPMADQATETAQNYRPETYQGSNQSGGGDRYMPQQFGQEGDVYNPEEGPLTPQQTAEAMPTSKDAMQKLINQHMLGPRGGLPQASKEGYDNYVTASREKRAAEKDQLRQQADVNRVQRSARNAETDEAMQRANPGMNAGGGYGGQMSSGNRVQNIGGYTFVKGTWRPQTPEENAKVRQMDAQTDYLRQRPDIAREGNEARRTIAQGHDAARVTTTGMNVEGRAEQGELNRGAAGDRQDKSLDFKARQLEELNKYRASRLAISERMAQVAEQAIASRDAAAANKIGQETQGALTRTIAELKAREGSAGKDQSYINKLTGIGQSPKQLRDRQFDKSGKPGANLTGSYDVLVDEALRYAAMLDKLHNETNFNLTTASPDEVKFLERLAKERGQVPQ